MPDNTPKKRRIFGILRKFISSLAIGLIAGAFVYLTFDYITPILLSFLGGLGGTTIEPSTVDTTLEQSSTFSLVRLIIAVAIGLWFFQWSIQYMKQINLKVGDQFGLNSVDQTLKEIKETSEIT